MNGTNKTDMHEVRVLIQRWVFDHLMFNPKNIWKSKEYIVWSKEESVLLTLIVAVLFVGKKT